MRNDRACRYDPDPDRPVLLALVALVALFATRRIPAQPAHGRPASETAATPASGAAT